MDGNPVTMKSLPEAKIRMFRAMFCGRDDVYARRWESKAGKTGYQPVCANLWVRGVCPKCVSFRGGGKTTKKPTANCAECPVRQFEPISDQMIANHLRGKDEKGEPFVMGVYPLLADDTVKFAAIDFDKASWRADVHSVIEVLRELELPVACERSRSGNGAHLWFFFEEPLAARYVRDVLSFVLTLTMERNPSMGLDSYDRIFPCQNRVPKGGFGNLIALPLQGIPRQIGNSVFVNDDLVPHSDQWQFLSELPMIAKDKLMALRDRACSERRLIAPQRDEEIERNEPWSLFVPGVAGGTGVPPVRRGNATSLPSQNGRGARSPCEIVKITLGNAVYISQEGLDPVLRGKLIRLAAFANPAFRDAERLRLPVYKIPRVISRAIDGENFLILPRGCLEDVLRTLKGEGVEWTIEDRRIVGTPINCKFDGELRDEQKVAAKALCASDVGVLAAGTAFGKTVLAAWMISERKVNTLVLVNRKPLANQWVERLSQFLGMPKKEIGRWGGGRHKYTGRIDVALIQGLTRKGEVNKEIIGSYGQLIVDECHGISAPSFESVANAFAGKYVLGLSATVVRKDGQHPIIHMQCGPVRHRVEAKAMVGFERFRHAVEVRLTGFESTLDLAAEAKGPAYAKLISELANDVHRNETIIADVLKAVGDGRSPVVLTERREHLELLRGMLEGKVAHLLVLHGQMGAKQIKELDAERASIPDTEPRVLLATGSYIGEGFDDARLDSLFLTLPISWKGRLTQYAGRLHRRHAGKREVTIFDYADTNVEMLARMFNKRCAGYKALGYEIVMPLSTASGLPSNVSVLREKKLDETYAESVKRLLRSGVSAEEVDLFAFAAEQTWRLSQTGGSSDAVASSDDENARSAVERFLHKHLESLPQTAGKFELNGKLDIPFGGNPQMEVDFLARSSKLAVEVDGYLHFNDKNAYRRDRRKDELLQSEGYFVLRFLAEDVMSDLGNVIARIIRHL